MTVLPWVAVGGLLYLIATNKPQPKSIPTASGGAVPTPTPGCQPDFGVTGCWCG
jgi:hypothetical protein